MNNIEDFLSITEDILLNEEFNKLKNIEHHGVTRYDHSYKVAYYAYKVACKLKLDVREMTRGALLHDFFLSEHDNDTKERLKSYFKHPKLALKTSMENFDLSSKEKNIIKSHMYPVSLYAPKYLEAWLVGFVDKYVSIEEMGINIKNIVQYSVYAIMILFINVNVLLNIKS